jgi:AhpD family alkylhydroperoxidase
MHARLEAQKASPAAYQALLGLEMFVRKQSKLEPALIELVKMRASQINGCAYCIDMHSKDARAEGETEQRIYALSAWEETPFFTDRERAALALTEAVTLISDGHVPDAVYEKARKSFSEEEMVNLTLAIITINGWNRLAITFRFVPGEYQPRKKWALGRLKRQKKPIVQAEKRELMMIALRREFEKREFNTPLPFLRWQTYVIEKGLFFPRSSDSLGKRNMEWGSEALLPTVSAWQRTLDADMFRRLLRSVSGEASMTEHNVHGFVETKFSLVRDKFEANFASGADAGASCCATADGKTVVDLWGGFADEAKTRPWEKDTILNVYSTTKTMTALTALLIADRGELDFDAPVAKYWPEFGPMVRSGLR